MADSTLDPDNIAVPDRQLGKGHGIDALGPSDTSDSGSDMSGNADGLAEDDDFAGEGATGDQSVLGGNRAAQDDQDTDASGTGERGTVPGENDPGMGSDIAPDRVFQAGVDNATEDEEAQDAAR